MHANVETNERIKELIAAIQIEADHKKLIALVAELNRLLDGDKIDERSSSASRATGEVSPLANPAVRSEGM